MIKDMPVWIEDWKDEYKRDWKKYNSSEWQWDWSDTKPKYRLIPTIEKGIYELEKINDRTI